MPRTRPPIPGLDESPRDLVDRLQAFPPEPKLLSRPRNWTTALRSVRDYLVQAPLVTARLGGLISRYPKPFQKVSIPSLDGIRLSAWLGVHHRRSRRGRPAPEERPGILIVPGMFSSKDNIIHRARALRFFLDWGYHVLVVDLRGFGESKRVPNTGGWKESDDVIAAVRTFRAKVPLERLHIYSESLGASAALIAAGRVARQGERLIDGRLLAVSPYGDAKREVGFLSEMPVRGPEFYMVQWFFIRLLRLGGQRYRDFREYFEAAAIRYGMRPDELYDLSSAKNFLASVNVPSLLLYSDDDPVVPPEDADDLERLLHDRDNPLVWRLEWGSHCLYEMFDPAWYWRLLRAFFDFDCPLPSRTP